MKQYRVVCTVPEDQLAHAVAYATNFFGQVTVTSIETIQRELKEAKEEAKLAAVRERAKTIVMAPRRKSPEPHKRRGGGNPTGQEVVLEAMAGGEMPVSALKNLFREHGFAPNGASPIMTKMKRKGLVQLVRPGVYALTRRPAVAPQEQV